MREENEREWAIFAHNVAWLRKHHGLSKKKMAALLHIGVNTLTKVENGQLPPRLTADVFFYIEDHFGIDPVEQLTHRLGE